MRSRTVSLNMLLAISAITTALLMLSHTTYAYTSLLVPASREGGKQVFADANNTIGCPKPSAPGGSITTVSPGMSIRVEYYRNNQIGGFIRWAMVKKGTPESHANFDANVFFYTCRETGTQCMARTGRKYSLYKDASDGVGPFTVTCGISIDIPDYLDDGEYVLQFTSYGAGYFNGSAGDSAPIYRSCADLKIKGASFNSSKTDKATKKSKTKKPACPKFVAGDRAAFREDIGNVCAYYYSNEMQNYMVSEKEPVKIDANYHFGKPAALERCEKAHGMDRMVKIQGVKQMIPTTMPNETYQDRKTAEPPKPITNKTATTQPSLPSKQSTTTTLPPPRADAHHHGNETFSFKALLPPAGLATATPPPTQAIWSLP